MKLESMQKYPSETKLIFSFHEEDKITSWEPLSFSITEIIEKPLKFNCL